MSSFAYDPPFTPARSRKKRKNRPAAAPIDPLVALERMRDELRAGEWTHECQKHLRDALETLALPAPLRVLCLGLGSPCASPNARAQLAWLLDACDALSIERANIAAYDPVFTDEDDALLAAVRVQRLSDNRCAAYALAGPTVVFMPHCDVQLYDNLLRENWARAQLAEMVLVANRFSEYLDSIPKHKLDAEHPCVARLGPLLTTLPLPPCPPHPNAFNNLAVQFARPDALPLEGDFWILPPPRPRSAHAEGSHDCVIAPPPEREH